MPLILSLCLTLTITIILLFTPLYLGLWILLLALSISVLIGPITSSWFRFIVFLIYIGGILVIFAYFAAIQPNQDLKITPLVLLTLSTTILIFSIIPLKSILVPISFTPAITSLFHIHNIPILIALAIILFLALIAVVKISHINYGPLRPFNYVQTITSNPPRY